MGCNECNKCKEREPSCNCNIVGRGGTTVTFEDNTYKVGTDFMTEVTSNDNTVGVTESTQTVVQEDGVDYKKKVFDLSVQCCDSKVAGCAADQNPSHLGAKLDVGPYLTKTTRNCPADGQVVIGVDAQAIANLGTDDKVSLDGTCTPTYLYDQIEVDSCFLEKVKEGCQMVIRDRCEANECSPCRTQYGKIRLANSKLIDQEMGSQKFYLFLGEGGGFTSGGPNAVSGTMTGSFTTIDANFTTELLSGIDVIRNTNGAVVGFVICRDGIYEVKQRGTIEVNGGVVAFRANTFLVPVGTTDVIPLLEERGSAPGVEGATGPADYNPPKNEVVHTNLGSGNYAPAASLGRYQERHSLNDSDIFRFNAGDFIYFGVKIDSFQGVTGHQGPAQFAVLGKDESAAGGDIGLSLSVHSIDDQCAVRDLDQVGPCTC